MSKLDDLINTLCPSGVEYKTLGEVCEIARGASPRPIHNYLTDKENGIPWIKIGDVEVNSKYVEETAEFVTKEGAEKSRLVKKGDFILSNSMSFGRPYILKIDGCIHDGWIYMRNYESLFLTDFLYYLLRSSKVQHDWRQRVSSGTVSNLNSDIVKATLIPVPPLEVQYEIVRILDKFTSLEAELEAELEARRKQYEYYRDSLLTFGDDVEWKRMDELFDIQMCKRILKQHTTPDGEIPFYQNGTIGKQAKLFITRELYEEMKAKYKLPKRGEILLSTAGTVGRAVVYNGEEAFFQDSNVVWLSNDESLINNEFLFHYCKSMPWKIPSRGTIKHLHNYMIAETLIPILSKERQSQVSQILDRFETLCNDITSGLPAEIEARHKQYEYYRDKLLTFKRKEV